MNVKDKSFLFPLFCLFKVGRLDLGEPSSKVSREVMHRVQMVYTKIGVNFEVYNWTW